MKQALSAMTEEQYGGFVFTVNFLLNI